MDGVLTIWKIYFAYIRGNFCLHFFLSLHEHADIIDDHYTHDHHNSNVEADYEPGPSTWDVMFFMFFTEGVNLKSDNFNCECDKIKSKFLEVKTRLSIHILVVWCIQV